jgi:hypothetical protein
MPGCPPQFADLLTPRGRAVLEGRVRAVTGVLKTGQRFVALPGLLDPAKCRSLLSLLESTIAPHLTRMDTPIPPETIFGMRHNYEELLPKTVRVSTVTMGSRSAGFRAVQKSGVLAMLRSDTFGRFAEVLSGRKVRKAWGTQLLAYGVGDYTGPHNDHHPEDREARDGYTDVHLTLCTPGVKRQALVYEQRGYLSSLTEVGRSGGVTAYRLPFWHYTTPLEGRTGARRWVLLGTFLDQ